MTGSGRLAGKVAIVTGGASGLGAADARMFAREGAAVVVTDVQAELGRCVAYELPNGLFIEQDVSDEAGWQAVVAETVTRFGRLDILVNNAGLGRYATIEECALDEFRDHFRIMVDGTFLGCRAAIPAMARSGGGSIVNIASLAAVLGIAVAPAYSAAKGAIVALTRSVAIHCKERRYGIRCNAVLPGGHDTPLMATSLAALPLGEAYSDMVRREGIGQPDDVAGLVTFLASDESRRITGAAMLVDNGESIS